MNCPNLPLEQSKLLIESLRNLRLCSNPSTSRLRKSSNESLKKDTIKTLPKLKPISAKIALQYMLKVHPNTSSNSVLQQENLTCKHSNHHRSRLNLQDDATSIIVLETDRLSPVRSIQVDLQQCYSPSHKPTKTNQSHRKSKSSETFAGSNQQHRFLINKAPKSRLGALECKENPVVKVSLNNDYGLDMNLIKPEVTLKIAFRENEAKPSAMQIPMGNYDGALSPKKLPRPPKRSELRTQKESLLRKTENSRLEKNDFVENKLKDTPKVKDLLEIFPLNNSKIFLPFQSQLLQNFGERNQKIRKIEITKDTKRNKSPVSVPKQIERKVKIRRMVLVPKVKEQKVLSIGGSNVGVAFDKTSKSESPNSISMNSKEFAEKFRNKMLNRGFNLPIDLSLNTICLMSVTTSNGEMINRDKFNRKIF